MIPRRDPGRGGGGGAGREPPPRGPADAVVRAAIRERGGWLPFDQFLDLALHHPQCGFYGGGRVRFGVDGDFATAPLLSPLFAECLAAQMGDILRETGGGVLELGAGDGSLARDLSRILAAEEPLPFYDIVEISPSLRARQRERLRGSPGIFRWRDSLPDKFCGVMFANEALDAVPFRLFCRRDGVWLERGVALADDELAFADRAAADAATRRLAATELPDGAVAEVNARAEALTRSLAERLTRGALLMADYGRGRAELYHPERSGGTMLCHRAGRTDAEPLAEVGAKDITAQVDFTAMADAGLAGGCELLGYAEQARFLVNCGMLPALAARDDGGAEYARWASGAQKLLAPQEMGSLVKFIAWGRGFAAPLRGFAAGDLRHKL